MINHTAYALYSLVLSHRCLADMWFQVDSKYYSYSKQPYCLLRHVQHGYWLPRQWFQHKWLPRQWSLEAEGGALNLLSTSRLSLQGTITSTLSDPPGDDLVTCW